MAATFPFFIAGSGRCGTTLLRRILCNSDSVVIPPENYALAHSQDVLREVQSVRDSWGTFVRTILDSLTQQTNWSDFHIDAADAIRRLSSIEPRTAGGFWNAFHRLYAESVRPGATRWGDKTPLNAHHIESVFSMFPEARCVHLVRDAYDTVASYARMAGREGRYVEGAHRWVDANARLMKCSKPDQVLRVRYEDLTREPVSTVKEVCGFLVIPFTAELISDLGDASMLSDTGLPHLRAARTAVNTESIGLGRKELSPQAIRAITEIAGGVQRALGYHIIEV